MPRYTAKQRAAAGTVKDPATGKKTKFPINDKTHAVQAIRFEGRAKPPLTPKERATVERKAAQFGVGPKAQKKPTKKG